MAHYVSRRGCDRIVVVFTTTDAISTYHHWCCELESRSGRGVQHYVIKCVSDLRKFGGFFPGPPVSSTNKGGCHDITEILLKVALTTITQTKKNNMCDEEKITDITVFSNDRSKQFHVSLLLFSLFVIRMSNTDEHTSNCFLWNANRYLNPVFSKHTESMEYHYNLHLLIPHVRPSYHII